MVSNKEQYKKPNLAPPGCEITNQLFKELILLKDLF